MTHSTPSGYRRAIDADYTLDLDKRINLLQLCRCGHLGHEHSGTLDKGHCSRCKCERFYWVAHVVKLPE